MKNIILAPASKVTSDLLSRELKSGCTCIGICDKNPDLWGIKIKGITVIPYEELLNLDYEKIIISTANFETADSVREEIYDLGIAGNKVVISYGASGSKYCDTVLDEYFVIEKGETIPFEIKPAEIYMQYKGETYKSEGRRKKEGFYEKYCQGLGLDIGYGADLIKEDACGWDLRNGDAQYLRGIQDETFDYVYSSHCLEHLYNVRIAINNWYRVLKKGGYLIISIPQRDLYEKKKMLPSRWNFDHKHMFLLGNKDDLDTLDIIEEIRESINDFTIVYAKTCDYGHTITDPLKHSDGEYQIEIVIRKE